MKKTLFVLSLALFMGLFASCSSQYMKGRASSISQTGDVKMVKITGDQVGIKSGCSENTPDIQKVGKNAKLDVISKVADWYAVRLPDNQIGFVPQGEGMPIVPYGNIPAPPGTAFRVPEAPAETAPAPAPGGTINNPANNGINAPNNTSPNNTTLTSMEQEMLQLINQERSKNNAAPLKVDPTLENMSRVKAQDMIDNNYFSHNSPSYGSPFDMMKSFGISYVEAGENIAGNQSVQKAHASLMNSPDHRKNILNPHYTHIGVGIRQGSGYGYIFVQEFISQPQ